METFGLLLDLRMWLLVLLVSGMATAATLSYYYLGKQGSDVVLDHLPRFDRKNLERVDALYGRHGSILLFLSFVPLLGMLLEAAAGTFGIGLPAYILWVFLGRIVRNWSVLLLFDQGLRFVSG